MCRMLGVLSRPGRTAGPRDSSYLLKFTHTSAGFSGCFWSGTKYVLTRSRSTVGMLILLVLVCIEVFFWRGSEHGGRAFSRMKAFDEKPTVAEVVSSGIAQRVAASANHYNASLTSQEAPAVTRSVYGPYLAAVVRLCAAQRPSLTVDLRASDTKP